ncbi:MAG TPA: MFS transporter [Thermoanaerobaculia bacterium]|nr:MFS transporter [Thermoanaerobaculia bacterium]
MVDSAAVTTAQGLPRRRVLFTIFLTVLLDLIGFGMILPILSYYPQRFGASAFEIGVLFSSYSLAQLFFAPPLGRLSDRVGRRPVLVTSIAGSVFAYLLFAFAPSFWILVLARSLSGIAASNYSIAQAYLADVSKPEERSKAMGFIGAAFGLGFVLGPAFGAVLSSHGDRAVGLAAAGLALLNFLFALVWLPESLPAELRSRVGKNRWFDVRGFASLAANRPLFGLLVLYFLVTFCFVLMESTLGLYCQLRFGWGRRQTGLFFVYVGIILVIVQGGLLGRLVRRFGERWLILTGMVLMAAGLFFLPTAPTVLLFGLTGALLAIGNGLNSPATLGLVSRLTDESEQGGTIGISRSFSALARFLGPLAGTFLFGMAGARSAAWPFWAASGLLLLSLFYARNLLRKIQIG